LGAIHLRQIINSFPITVTGGGYVHCYLLHGPARCRFRAKGYRPLTPDLSGCETRPLNAAPTGWVSDTTTAIKSAHMQKTIV